MPPRAAKKVHPRRPLPEDDDVPIREEEVLDAVPMGKTSLRRAVANGTFPPPTKLSARINIWRTGAIRAYLASLYKS